MNSSKMGIIGIILTAFSPVAAFLWWFSMGYLLLTWGWSYFAFAVLMVGPSIVLTIVGFALYIADRKVFWKVHRNLKVLLATLGSILILLGGLLTWFYYSMSVYQSTKHGPPWDKPLGYILTDYSPYFILFALWFIAGVILFADAMLVKTKT